MSRTRSVRSRRTALLLAPMLAAVGSGAHAVAIEGSIDLAAYFCSAADNLTMTVAEQPIWSWTCGDQNVTCVQAGVDSSYELDAAKLVLECFQQTPESTVVFFDNFE